MRMSHSTKSIKSIKKNGYQKMYNNNHQIINKGNQKRVLMVVSKSIIPQSEGKNLQ